MKCCIIHPKSKTQNFRPSQNNLVPKDEKLPQHVPVSKISTKVLIAQHKFHPRGDSSPWYSPGSGTGCDLNRANCAKGFFTMRSHAKRKLRQFSP